ncbi:MAG: uridine kinase [Verrucomicrobia bacterium]|nr:uridine kinase [Verrucomicrobiota bacterium]
MTTRLRPRPSAAKSPAVILVAIAGGSGSGKTWLATSLHRRLRPHAGLISLDDFYRDLSHLPLARRARTNFDSPAAIDWRLFATLLRALAAGETPILPRYDFARHNRAARVRRWRRKRIVLVEGLWPWAQPHLRRLFALRIYREADPDLRYERRLRRDVRHRGRTPESVDHQWRLQVEPMFTRHVAPQRRTADVVLGARVTPAELAALARRIRRLAA